MHWVRHNAKKSSSTSTPGSSAWRGVFVLYIVYMVCRVSYVQYVRYVWCRMCGMYGMYSMYGMVWSGMVWYGMAWYGMVWFGMAWYGTVWYGMYVCMYAMRQFSSTVPKTESISYYLSSKLERAINTQLLKDMRQHSMVPPPNNISNSGTSTTTYQ